MCQEHKPLHCYLQANPHLYTFILFASCWYMTPSQGVTLKFNGRHHLFSTSGLLPGSLCAWTVQLEFGRSVTFALSGGQWQRKSQKIRMPQLDPGAAKRVISVLSCHLLAVSMAAHLLCWLLPTISSFTQEFLAKQNRSSPSLSCAHPGFTCSCCFSQQLELPGDGQWL